MLLNCHMEVDIQDEDHIGPNPPLFTHLPDLPDLLNISEFQNAEPNLSQRPASSSKTPNQQTVSVPLGPL